MKNICILGSTGSIGTQALDIVRQNKDKFNIVGLSAGGNQKLMREQIEEFEPNFASLDLIDNFAVLNEKTVILDNAIELIKECEADIYLLATVGMSGLPIAYEAVKKGKIVALANKETMVSAGELINKLAKEYGTTIIPVDSEHSAIFQCLQAGDKAEVSKIILTASGGAFRDKSKEFIQNAKAKDALKHPTWKMGNKVTIDSTSLMNKGLEIIEAMYLFNIPIEMIDVIIHPQSIIHSLVEFTDGCVIAQMSHPDMHLPIQYSFTYPNRIGFNNKPFSLSEITKLDFMAPQFDKFPNLKLAMECAKKGSLYCGIMNSANEGVVSAFLQDKISFYQMTDYIKSALDKFSDMSNSTIDEIIDIDIKVKEYILTITK